MISVKYRLIKVIQFENWKKTKRFKALHTRFYVQPNMQKKLNAVGYGDTCNNNINIFYTCIRIAKKEIDIE